MYINLLNQLVAASIGKPTIFRSLHQRPNYYEILRVKSNCTSSEIKKAYIDLTKKLHPDITKNSNTKEFVKVLEAYNVLSKSDSRREYDRSQKWKRKPDYHRNYPPTNSMYDTYDFHQRNFDRNGPFYGMHRTVYPNSIIALACLIIATIGLAVQVMLIRYSVTFRRDELKRRSDIAMMHLKQTQEQANRNGNNKQLELLEQKFKKDGN